MPRLYRGFSSDKFNDNKTLGLYDIELVKKDLLNHIFTRKGERVMMPRFGSIIPDLVFEPLTPILVEDVTEELTTIFNYDPRVNLVDIQTKPDYVFSSLRVECKLFYVELNMVENFELNISFNQ